MKRACHLRHIPGLSKYSEHQLNCQTSTSRALSLTYSQIFSFSNPKMCWYKRLIYSRCNHFAWVDRVKLCHIQIAHDADTENTAQPCNMLLSSPFCSYRVDLECSACRAARWRVTDKISKARTILEDARKRLSASGVWNVSSPASVASSEAVESRPSSPIDDEAEESFEPVDEQTLKIMTRTEVSRLRPRFARRGPDCLGEA